jgi:hypothetical protein
VTTSTIYGEGDTLKFFRRSIRILPVRGIPWFALPDLCDVLGYDRQAMALVNDPRFPVAARLTSTELPDDDVPGEPEDVIMVSPVGVWWWTHLTDPLKGQQLAAWAKKQALRLAPEAALTDPAVYLQLQQDGSLPPYPSRYSGRKSEWIGLRERHGYLVPAVPASGPREGPHAAAVP